MKVQRGYKTEIKPNNKQTTLLLKNVSGMMKNRCLSRSIADLGLFEWTCAGCGTCHDRDFNASKNLEYAAASSSEAGNAYGEGSGSELVVLSETGF